MCYLSLQILADAMGLGKTVMTIALILSNPRGECSNYTGRDMIDLQGHGTRARTSTSSAIGGTLIVCPMPLLGQWKVSIFYYSVHVKCLLSTICLQYALIVFVINVRILESQCYVSLYPVFHAVHREPN